MKILQVSFLLHCFTLRNEKGIAAKGYILKNVVNIFFFFFFFFLHFQLILRFVMNDLNFPIQYIML